MGALQTIIIRGPKQSLSGETKAFGLKLVEVLTVHGGVTLIKIIARLLDFVLMVDLAVGHMLVPLDVIDGIFPLQVHGQAFQTIGELRADGRKIDPANLLEIGELRHFHAVQPHFPAKPPRAEGRRLPVVFDEADVMLFLMDPQCTKAAKVEILHIVGRGLQNDLKLEIVLKPIGVFAIPPVRGTPRRLHIGHTPRLRPDNPQKRRRVKRAGTTFYIHRLSDDASPARPIALQSENHILKIHASSMTIAALTRRGIPFRKNSHSRPFLVFGISGSHSPEAPPVPSQAQMILHKAIHRSRALTSFRREQYSARLFRRAGR